jgi:hypothetical protein
VDEEISAKVIDYLDRNDPKRTNKPFFVWYKLLSDPFVQAGQCQLLSVRQRPPLHVAVLFP